MAWVLLALDGFHVSSMGASRLFEGIPRWRTGRSPRRWRSSKAIGWFRWSR